MVTDPPTNTARHKHTNPQTGPITIHCAAKLSAQCNKECTSTTLHTLAPTHSTIINSYQSVSTMARSAKLRNIEGAPSTTETTLSPKLLSVQSQEFSKIIEWMNFIITLRSALCTFLFSFCKSSVNLGRNGKKTRKISPVGTDGRLPLSDLDLGFGHTAYRIPSCITHRPLPTYQISLRSEDNFFWKSPLRFWSSSESRDTKTRTNIKNPARSI